MYIAVCFAISGSELACVAWQKTNALELANQNVHSICYIYKSYNSNY